MNSIINIPHISFTENGNFFLIAGPCVVESKANAEEIAEKVKNITNKLQIPFIFKASFRKANRSKMSSFSGIGDQEALGIIQSIGENLKVPTLTDVHNETDVLMVSQFVDIIQIPAFLCRQTDLLIAAAKSGKYVNIKKGQFLSPASMEFAIDKVRDSGNKNVMVTERGTTFGYNDLVIDFRGIAEMKKFDVPVVLDVTHSLQQPNQTSGVTGGLPEMIETIAKAGIASGVDGIFIETHPDPSKALSDGANMLRLDKLEALLIDLIKIRKAII
jgi:2-dehydro-3-deoxyphosphooctonate aldolase (KDO 8-P synthase)